MADEMADEKAGQRPWSLLVARAKRGDRDAFGELFREHRAAIHRIARFYLPEVQAGDAVSETFLRAWVGLPRYKETGAPFRAWLAGIARHVVVDAIRVSARAIPQDRMPERTHAFEQGWVDRLALSAAVRELPEMQRLVIEYKYLLGWTNAEVAEVLGKTAGAVNSLQWRALEQLKTMIGSR